MTEKLFYRGRKMKKMRKDWPLGFLSLLSIQGFVGLANGDYLQAVWIAWLAWLVFFMPQKNKEVE